MSGRVELEFDALPAWGSIRRRADATLRVAEDRLAALLPDRVCSRYIGLTSRRNGMHAAMFWSPDSTAVIETVEWPDGMSIEDFLGCILLSL